MISTSKILSSACLSLLFIGLMSFTGCQTTNDIPAWDTPYSLRTFPAGYTAYVLEIADANKDGDVTLVEWTNAGGDKRSFLIADVNKDGRVTRTELVRLSSNAKFFDFTRRYADFNKDNQLTPREFRTASGVQVLRFTF